MDYITIVKFTSLILAVALAILGTTTDFKKKGKMTKWGRIAISVLIVSGVVSVVLLGWEETNKAAEKEKAEKKANEERAELNRQFENIVKKAEENIGKTNETLNQTQKVAEDVRNSVETQQNLIAQTKDISGNVTKNLESQNQLFTQSKEIAGRQVQTFLKTQNIQAQQEHLLENTYRALIPVNQLAIAYSLDYPLNLPQFQIYKKRIEDIANAQVPQRFGSSDEHELLVSRDDANKFDNIIVGSESDLLPSSNDSDEKDAFYLINPQIRLKFFKNITIDDYNKDDDDKSDSIAVDLDIITTAKSEFRESWIGLDDISLDIGTKTNFDFLRVGLRFNYRSTRLTETLTVETSTNQFSYWHTETGKISGLYDLQNSLIIVELWLPEASVNDVDSFDLALFVGAKYERRISLELKKLKDNFYYDYIQKSDINIP